MPPIRKFLIVDDDPPTEDFIIEKLESAGEVHFVRTWEKAAKAARKKWLGAMIATSLPRGKGNSLAIVRQLMCDQNTECVVLLTDDPDPDDRVEELSSLPLPGAVPVLKKPLDEIDLNTFAIRSVAWAWTGDRRLTELVVHYSAQTGLIPREAEIVAATMAGASRSDLAGSLRVSENTLKGPIRVLLAKCGARTVESLVNRILIQALG